MGTPNSTLLKRDGAPFPVRLGYDPSAYPMLETPGHDLAYIVFGWCMYETIECGKLLWAVRAKMNSGIYRALVISIILHAQCYVMGATGYGSLPAVANDLFAGPIEFKWIVYGMASSMVARWAYIYATLHLALAVFPGNKIATRCIYLVTLLPIVGTIWCFVILVLFYRMQYVSYLTYKETNDIGATFNSIFDTLGLLPQLEVASAVQAISLIVFMFFTKIPFLWAIFKALNIPFKEAIKTMSQTRSTVRIFTSSVWTLLETVLFLTVGVIDITFSADLFAMAFQINTLAMLAFEGSTAIIQTHSRGKRAPTTKGQQTS